MYKLIFLYCSCLLVILFTGCANVSVGKNFNNLDTVTANSYKPVAHINAYNYGYYLFGEFPIITGSAEEVGGTSFFYDQATIPKMTGLVTAESKKLKATNTVNLTSSRSSTGGFSLWIIWFKEVQVSGDAIAPKT
jgi:hypothetical protein